MNKKELKSLIKPIVKECIYETLVEEGILSNVVSEVAKGLQDTLIVEQRVSSKPSRPLIQKVSQKKTTNDRQKNLNKRKELMDAIGTDAYNGVNLFEGTSALTNREATNEGDSSGAVELGAPNDPGVDISTLIPGASRMWDAMK